MFRLNLYQRYLMRETFAAVFLVLAAFLALFSFFDLINELRNVSKAGYQLGHALLFVTLSVPGKRCTAIRWSRIFDHSGIFFLACFSSVLA